jgi:hypothetical protein
MFTWNRLAAVPALLALAAASLPAQQTLRVDFPPESPVTVVAADWGASEASPRGGALVVDLHTTLRLRNSGRAAIRGITLLVLAQEVTPGGKASVAVPSLNVAPGETFPVRIDLRLLRPLQAPAGPLVRVELDGVLFEDLTFYGPDRLNSRRSMTAWEIEARRDRRHFKSVLAARGPEGLREEVLASLVRQAERPSLDVQVARRDRATNAGAARELQFAFLRFPDSPIEPLAGVARLDGQEASDATVEVRNRSARAVRYFEIGWIVQDRLGRQFLAGSVPAETHLSPGATGRVRSDATLRFGRPLVIEAMKGFVSKVEFEDGEFWVPSRPLLAEQRLDRLLAPSPEEQRLTNLYRRKGLEALIEELNRF